MEPLSQIADQGLFCPCPVCTRTVCGFSFFSRFPSKKDYLFLIPSRSRVLCRWKDFFCKFLGGVIHWLKRYLGVIWKPPAGSLIWAYSRRFFLYMMLPQEHFCLASSHVFEVFGGSRAS